jgi:hypothetical protein
MKLWLVAFYAIVQIEEHIWVMQLPDATETEWSDTKRGEDTVPRQAWQEKICEPTMALFFHVLATAEIPQPWLYFLSYFWAHLWQ